jgi:sulfur carrier protein ThiS
VFTTVLLASSTLAQTHPAAPESPYGGATVEEIIARVNDQIITRSDYDRAMKELDDEARQHGASMQEISAAHKDLLRNLIDQQLWLSKGKELGITGETELVNRLNEIRKQYHLETMEDLEKAAKEQGVSFEDFKANIRNGIITQEVMRQEVGKKVQFTPGEAERYFEQHKQEYAQPESVTLAEILVSTGTPAPSALEHGRRRAARRSRQSWPRPRPRPTTSRPSSTPAATLANWRAASATAPRPPRAAIWASTSAAPGQGARGSDLRAQAGPVHRAHSHQAGLRHSQGGAARPRRRSGSTRTSRSRWRRTSTWPAWSRPCATI